MVKKLFKHEFIYYLRTLIIFLPIMLVLGTVARISIAVHRENNIYTGLAMGSSITLLIVAGIGLMLFATVLSIVRFYKNMYSLEGYLTFTLPVNNHQHIFVKLTVALIFQCITMVIIFLGAVIAASGEPLAVTLKFIGEVLKVFFEVVHPVNTIFYIIEMLLIFVLYIAVPMLLYYACISIGQLAKKNRILMAFIAYFVHNVLMQVLSTIATIILAIIGSTGEIADQVITLLDMFGQGAMHIILIGYLLFQTALAVLYYFVTHYIMTKKLNLE